MGGYDVYYVELFKNDSVLHRLDAPINSSADDIYFKMLQDSSVACVSSNRLGGLGEMDIYKLIFHQFDLATCDPSKLQGSKIFMRGQDTVLMGGRLVMDAYGSEIGGLKPRTIHWYLNDSLVGNESRLNVPIEEEGQFDLKLYASVIDEEQIKFHSACTARTIHVLPPKAYVKDALAASVVDGLPDDLSEGALLGALPMPKGEIPLKNDVVTTYVNAPVQIEVFKNDKLEEGAHIKLENLSRPLHGSVVIADREKGKVFYYPSSDFVGMDAFRYTAKNPYGTKGEAWVGIRVLDNALFSENKMIRDDEVTTQQNTPVTINLFKNDVLKQGERERRSRAIRFQ